MRFDSLKIFWKKLGFGNAKTFRKKRGDKGEKFAAKFLQKEGMKILLRNFRFGNDEIDIVALDENCRVVIEVKTRSENDLQGGFAAVNQRKRDAQRRAIYGYLRQIPDGFSKARRFDVVEVTVRERDEKMTAVHHKNVPLKKERRWR